MNIKKNNSNRTLILLLIIVRAKEQMKNGSKIILLENDSKYNDFESNTAKKTRATSNALHLEVKGKSFSMIFLKDSYNN